MLTPEIESKIVSKVVWRLVPFMIVLYLFNYLDRVNVGMAKLKMMADIHINEEVMGFGLGVFFFGYFFFEVPSNIMLERLGARVWIARIMISWGLVTTAFVFVTGPWSFNLVRFLLGAAEAGFFPGMVLYLTYWIPARHRGRVGAIFMTSIALAGVIGSPLAGGVMDLLNGAWGLKGWQWLFLVEGIPTILLGIAVYFFFTDRPEKAKWLSDAERSWLCERMNAEQQGVRGAHGQGHLLDALKSGRVWLLSAIYMTMMTGFYPINFWTPSAIKEAWLRDDPNVTDSAIGIVTAIPFLGAIIAMVIVGLISDRLGSRRNIVLGGISVACLGMLGASQSTTLVPTVVSLTVAAMGIFSALAPFWTLPPAFLCGTASAAGIAFINSWGNLGGGYGANYLMGTIKEHTKSFSYGFLAVAGILLLGVLLTLSLALLERKPAALQSVPEAA